MVKFFGATVFILSLIVSGYSSSFMLAGEGVYPSVSRNPASTFSFNLAYERDDSELPREKIPKSSIAAIRTIGTITINFGATEQNFPFYLTQYPDNSDFSLIGFYIDGGYPHVLQFQQWSGGKEFILYESFRRAGETLRGTAVLTQLH